VDRSPEFLHLYDGARARQLGVPAAAADHEFLLVPGFMWDFTPRMFGPNISELRSMGIRSRIVRVHSLGEVKRNARIVAEAIERSPKKVVLITHSKGGLDAMQALADRPDLVSKVAAFVAIQTPYDGVAFAAPLRYWPTLRVMIQAAARLIRHQWRGLSMLFDDAIGDLLRRSADAAKPPDVPRLVSIVSELGRDAPRAFLPLRLTRAVAKWATGKDSDGFVRPEESVLPNSEVIRLPGMSHSDPVLNLGPLGRPIYDARALTRALVAYLFP
jgi:pimeloyl-ACP methyl ester carboxylesterase